MDTAELEQFFISTWTATVKKSKAQHDEDDKETIDKFKTWEALTEWLLGSVLPSLAMTRPSLSHLRAFASFSQENLVPGGLDASYLWGSLACLLQLISRNPKTYGEVSRMIKSLALKTEVFNAYCARSHEISTTIKEVCFDMQLQFVDFLTISIKLIRNTEQASVEYSDPSVNQHGRPEQRIQRRYELSSVELGEALSRLEKLTAVQAPTTGTEMATSQAVPKLRLNMMQPAKTSRLFDRLDVFLKFDELLTPDAGEYALQSVALHGLGGVGKSSIASSYAEKKFSEQTFDMVLWVCSEKDVSLQQSFTDIALRLKLPGAQPQSHDENQVLVQDWFQSTSKSDSFWDELYSDLNISYTEQLTAMTCKWLVVYDNVESASMLGPYWARPSRYGRAIITTRNRSLAFDPAASGMEITSWYGETGAEFLLFLLKRSIGRDINSETFSARTLSDKLSGHALALQQIAGLIHDGEYSIREFTAMCLQNPRSAHSMDELAALWDYSFRSLDKNSFSLLGIISFLMPDNIPSELLEPQGNQELPPDLKFLKETFAGFSAALRKLITRALIKRNQDSGVVTVHRLVQTQFRYFLGPEQRQKFFNHAVTLASYLVPKSEMEKGHLFDVWTRYNKYLQHVLSLRDIFDEKRKYSSPLKAPQIFCEILNDYQRYLYEKGSFEECERTCAINRAAVSTLSSVEEKIDLEGTIISHQAQIVEKLGNFHEAIEICQQGMNLRLGECPRKQILLAYTACNLGIIYSSANDFEKATEWFQQTRQWWEAHFGGKSGTQAYAASILVSEARCMMGLNKLDAAEEILGTTIAQVKREKPLNFGTLAYAHFCFGTLDRCRHRFESAEKHFIESQNAWLMGDNTRLHPFNAGILYKIGVACLDQGKIEAAIKHIRDSLEVTEFYSRLMPVEHGRNFFKLSEAYLQSGDNLCEDAKVLRDKAEFFLRQKTSDLIESGTESAYDDQIPVYWR